MEERRRASCKAFLSPASRSVYGKQGHARCAEAGIWDVAVLFFANLSTLVYLPCAEHGAAVLRSIRWEAMELASRSTAH